MRIKTKILVFFITILIVMMLIISFSINYIINVYLCNNLISTLKVIGQIVSNAVVAGLEFDDKDELKSSLSVFSKQELFSFIQVKNKSDQMMYSFRREGFEQIKDQKLPELQIVKGEIFSTIPVDSKGKIIGKVEIGVSTKEIKESVSSIRRFLIILFFLILAISAFLSWFLSNIITRALNKMIFVVKDISEGEGDLTRRI